MRNHCDRYLILEFFYDIKIRCSMGRNIDIRTSTMRNDLFNESTLTSSKHYIPILTSILKQATTFPHVVFN